MVDEEVEDVVVSNCVICGARAIHFCALCEDVCYCGREHQKSHWKQHKKVCKGRRQEEEEKPQKSPPINESESKATAAAFPAASASSTTTPTTNSGKPSSSSSTTTTAKARAANNSTKKQKQKKQNTTNDTTTTFRSTNFKVGDRVILHGLKNAKRMNNMHGRVVSELDSNGRHQVILDLILEPEMNPKVRPSNLKHCQKKINHKKQAGVRNGLLENESGNAVFNLLDIVRMVAANVNVVDLSGKDDLDNMDSTEVLEKLRDKDEFGLQQKLMEAGWEYWDKRPPGSSYTIYEHVKDQLQYNLSNRNTKNRREERTIREMMAAMDDKAAAKSWKYRVHGIFWVIDMDNNGTFLVADDVNHDYVKVYQALGVGDTVWSIVRNQGNGKAVRGILTLIPWYGRLVYDGIMASRLDLMPWVASDSLTATLRQAVATAKREGRLIQGLAQLED